MTKFRIVFITHDERHLPGRRGFRDEATAIKNIDRKMQVISDGWIPFFLDESESDYNVVTITSQMLDLGGTFAIEKIESDE